MGMLRCAYEAMAHHQACPMHVHHTGPCRCGAGRQEGSVARRIGIQGQIRHRLDGDNILGRPARNIDAAAEWMEAANAVDKLGTNVIPYALELAWTRDSALKRAILKSPWPRNVFNFFGWAKPYDRWVQASSVNPQIATEAFKFLGPRAKPAIPELLRLLRTSDNPNGRAAAARMLGRLGRDAQPALPELLQGFKDPNLSVREAVTEAVAGISSIEAPSMVGDDSAMAEYRRYQEHSVDLMVPVVLKLLTDPGADADRLIGTLQYFSFEEGWAATPGLLQLMNHPNIAVRVRATNALKRIHPSALTQH